MSNEKVSIEYAHIYSNSKIGKEHKFSLEILGKLCEEEKTKDNSFSLVVMIDDYSFPDPTFDYGEFLGWLTDKGFKPDLTLRESQLIPLCDEVIKLIDNSKLKDQISDYIIRTKKYPCSLFVATWYLLRLGCISSPLFNTKLVSNKLINILPQSFKPFEDQAIELISVTKFKDFIPKIHWKYFDGRLLA